MGGKKRSSAKKPRSGERRPKAPSTAASSSPTEKASTGGTRIKRGDGPSSFKRDLAWAAGLTLLAWVHRFFFLLSNRDRDWPFTIFYQGDAQSFFLQARAFLGGQLYDEGIPFHPPGFPLLLSAIHSFLGVGGETTIPHRSVRLLLAFLASLAIGFLFLLAKPYVGRLAATLAALLVTYHFGHYVLSVAPVGEGVYLTILIFALLWWSRRFDHPLATPRPPGRVASHRPWDGLVLGMLGGALALLRFESVLILGLVVGVGLWPILRRELGGQKVVESRQERRRILVGAVAPWLLVAVGWVLVVAPWTLRNHRTLSDYNERMGSALAEPLPTFVPVTLYGPINLALANQAGADGSFSPDALTGMTGGSSLDLTRAKHLEWILHGDRIAWRWIRENPADFGRLVVKKWRLASEVFALGFTQWNRPGGLNGVRRPVDIFVPEDQSLSWLFPLLMLVGGVLAWRSGGGGRRFLGITLLLTAAFLLTTALFYGYVRLALLVWPLWAVLAASALAALLERLPIPKKIWTLGAGILVLGLFLLEWRGSEANRNFRASASSTVDGHHLNPDDEIVLELIEAEER